jgi:hypothetical protein
MQGIAQQLKPILEESQQSMYVYLDDVHKLCNKKYARLLGYDSPEEWAAIQGSFPERFVAMESRNSLVKAYREAMKNKVALTLRVTWKKKNTKEIQTKVVLVPLVYEQQVYALHFISTG